MKSVFSLFIALAVASAGCVGGKTVVARRDLGLREEAHGRCVARNRARTRIHVSDTGALELDVQVVCRQLYVTRHVVETDVRKPSDDARTGGGLMATGTIAVVTGGIIGLGNMMSGLGGGYGSGHCSHDCDSSDDGDDSHAGTITALIGGGLIVAGVVVQAVSQDDEVTKVHNRNISSRTTEETTAPSGPILVRPPIGPAVSVTTDDHGRAIMRLPASVFAETDPGMLSTMLAQPWTLVIDGRPGQWKPSPAQVERLVNAAPMAVGAL